MLRGLESLFSIFSKKGINPKETRYTIPHPKDAAFAEFAALHHLSAQQIQDIIRTIGEQIELSRKFDLFVEWGHYQKEVAFILVFLDQMGGPSTIRERYLFNDAKYLLTEMMDAHFLNELSHYFTQCSNQGGIKNKYALHLESIRGRILNNIYNKEL
ncbi:MAG: hypothetical protein WCW78_00970 [Candidatus Paceibacterota bacterium]|jgi:hypothetical protein